MAVSKVLFVIFNIVVAISAFEELSFEDSQHDDKSIAGIYTIEEEQQKIDSMALSDAIAEVENSKYFDPHMSEAFLDNLKKDTAAIAMLQATETSTMGSDKVLFCVNLLNKMAGAIIKDLDAFQMDYVVWKANKKEELNSHQILKAEHQSQLTSFSANKMASLSTRSSIQTVIDGIIMEHTQELYECQKETDHWQRQIDAKLSEVNKVGDVIDNSKCNGGGGSFLLQQCEDTTTKSSYFAIDGERQEEEHNKHLESFLQVSQDVDSDDEEETEDGALTTSDDDEEEEDEDLSLLEKPKKRRRRRRRVSRRRRRLHRHSRRRLMRWRRRWIRRLRRACAGKRRGSKRCRRLTRRFIRLIYGRRRRASRWRRRVKKRAGKKTRKSVPDTNCNLSGFKPRCSHFVSHMFAIKGQLETELADLRKELSIVTTRCDKERAAFFLEYSELLKRVQESEVQASDFSAKMQVEQINVQTESKIANTLLGELAARKKAYDDYAHELLDTICSLKKIRKELMMLATKKPQLILDCVFGKWMPGKCSVSCAGGKVKTSRKVLQNPSVTPRDKYPGISCKLQTQSFVSDCNRKDCPINCMTSEWEGWGSCTSTCGGGNRQRSKRVLVSMQYKGDQCGSVNEGENCNVDACDADCVLGEWSKWGQCSQQCNSGYRRRRKAIVVPKRGAGKCPSQYSRIRQETRSCNRRVCRHVDKYTCNRKTDIILLIDGNGAQTAETFDKVKKFASRLVARYGSQKRKLTRISVLLVGGPKTTAEQTKCNSEGGPDCKITEVSEYSDDFEAIQKNIDGLKHPEGYTNTAVAVALAEAIQTNSGRKKANHIVISLQVNRPQNHGLMKAAVESIRRKSRYYTVALNQMGYRMQLKNFIKPYVSLPWHKNVYKMKHLNRIIQSETRTYQHTSSILVATCSRLRITRKGEKVPAAEIAYKALGEQLEKPPKKKLFLSLGSVDDEADAQEADQEESAVSKEFHKELEQEREHTQEITENDEDADGNEVDTDDDDDADDTDEEE